MGTGHWELDHAPVSVWTTQIELVFLNYYIVGAWYVKTAGETHMEGLGTNEAKYQKINKNIS